MTQNWWEPGNQTPEPTLLGPTIYSSILCHRMRTLLRKTFPWMNEWSDDERRTSRGCWCCVHQQEILPPPRSPLHQLRMEEAFKGLLSNTGTQSSALHILKCCAVKTGEEQGSVNNSPPRLGEIKNIFHCKRKVVIWDFRGLGQNTVSNGRTACISVTVFLFFFFKWNGRWGKFKKKSTC